MQPGPVSGEARPPLSGSDAPGLEAPPSRGPRAAGHLAFPGVTSRKRRPPGCSSPVRPGPGGQQAKCRRGGHSPGGAPRSLLSHVETRKVVLTPKNGAEIQGRGWTPRAAQVRMSCNSEHVCISVATGAASGGDPAHTQPPRGPGAERPTAQTPPPRPSSPRPCPGVLCTQQPARWLCLRSAAFRRGLKVKLEFIY